MNAKIFRGNFYNLWASVYPSYGTQVGHAFTAFGHIRKEHLVNFAIANGVTVDTSLSKDETAIRVAAKLLAAGYIECSDGGFTMKQAEHIQRGTFA